ncbi:MAG: hypothetical protein R3Y56_06985 [Akkermansia sp.]
MSANKLDKLHDHLTISKCKQHDESSQQQKAPTITSEQSILSENQLIRKHLIAKQQHQPETTYNQLFNI